MRNGAIKIIVEVSREDGSLAQQVIFDQRGLQPLALLAVQMQAVMPMARTLLELVSEWNRVSTEENTMPPQ